MASETPDDPATLAALGVLAMVAAHVAHEAIGHGGACLAVGGEVTRLTSIFFRCQGATPFTDVAGPLGGLTCGMLALGGLAVAPAGARRARLFLLLTGAVALFWFFGQMARDAALGVDDWAQIAVGSVWRWPLVALGVAGYAVTLGIAISVARSLAAATPGGTRRRLLVPYGAALVAAVAAGLLWHGDRLGAAKEELLTMGLAPLGYLWAARVAVRHPQASPPVARSWPWIAAAVIAFAAFALTQGLGLGRLS